MRTFGFTPIPERISRVVDLSYNLWWTWHPEAQRLFKWIDAELWEATYHNPVLFLREVRQVSLDNAASDPDFIRAYHDVLTSFDAYQVTTSTWFNQTYPNQWKLG